MSERTRTIERMEDQGKGSEPSARDQAPHPQVAGEQNSNLQPCYVTPAPLLDILVEQLEYLAAHVSHVCPAGCSDCARLSQVTNCLLLPFRASQSHASARDGRQC